MSKAKTLVVYDPIYSTLGGGERVLIDILRTLEPGDIYIPFIVNSSQTKDFLERIKAIKWNIYTKILNPHKYIKRFVFKYNQFNLYKQYKNFDTKKYTHILTYGAFLAHTITKYPNVRKIAYINTPTRVWWHLPYSKGILRKTIPSIFLDYVNEKNRMLDIQGMFNTDKILAISKNVQSRIYSFYNLESTLLYPPVNLTSQDYYSLKDFSNKLKQIIKSNKFFVHISRLEKYKNIQLLIKTYGTHNSLDLPLLFIIGNGAFRNYFINLAINHLKVNIQQIRVENYTFIKIGRIIFTGFIDETLKNSFIKYAQGVFALNDEDLGLSKVEAISLGTPVIACPYMANLEVCTPKTCVVLDMCNSKSLWQVIKNYKKIKISNTNIKKVKDKFNYDSFASKLRALVYA